MTALQIHDRILRRLGEDPADPAYWSSAEVYARIDEAQRFFVLLTLCLEKTTTYPLAAATPWVHLLPTVTDFLLPLHLRIAGGARIRPGRLAEFDLLDDAWQKTEGAPARYQILGFDLLAITPQPAAETAIEITHAYVPEVIDAGDDIPEIPPEFHFTLEEYAEHALRQKEGGQEFEKTLSKLDRFLSDAQKCGDFVRARSKAQRYDHEPFDLRSFDRSRLLDFAKFTRRATPWLTSRS